MQASTVVDWANLIVLLVGLLALISQNPIVPPVALPWIALAIGILNLVKSIFFPTQVGAKVLGLFASRAKKQ